MPRNTFLLRQLLIVLAHQQLLSHGCWATRTPAALAPTSAGGGSGGGAALPLVSSMEAASLADDWQASQRSADFDAFNEIPDALSSAERTPQEPHPDYDDGTHDLHANRYKIMAIHTNCTRDLLEMQFALNRNFHGRLYAKDFPLECGSNGAARTAIRLRVPTSGCGVRVEPRPDGDMELSVRVMLQVDQKLRQSADVLRTVRCRLPPNAMGMTVRVPTSEKDLNSGYRHGRMRTLPSKQREQHEQQDSGEAAGSEREHESTATGSGTGGGEGGTPRVRVWLELGGPEASGAVEVGQATTLTVRAIVPATMGVRVVDCAALDGLGESMQQLVDERGCPIDEQVMPPLQTHSKPVEEGWSKLDDNDLVEKSFGATFPAFKFPDRERLHVSCGVQLCKGDCPDINCRIANTLLLPNDERHLARIEVFNSLAVTAPQIELDRLRYDNRYNMSEDDYTYVRQLHGEGTLCLSVSKLALSFCILGLIFMIAVVVAIFSLLRTRRRNSRGCRTLTPTATNRLHSRAEICTSAFSSSSESAQSTRFGSKLFMPHYPNAFPYGRVY